MRAFNYRIFYVIVPAIFRYFIVESYKLPFRSNLRTLHSLLESIGDIYMSNNRFLMRSHNTISNITIETLDQIARETDTSNEEISRIVYGIAIFPVINAVVPIHDGKFQIQHTNVLPLNKDPSKFITCGFAPRASHVTNSPNEKDRPIDSVRLQALHVALKTSTPFHQKSYWVLISTERHQLASTDPLLPQDQKQLIYWSLSSASPIVQLCRLNWVCGARFFLNIFHCIALNIHISLF